MGITRKNKRKKNKKSLKYGGTIEKKTDTNNIEKTTDTNNTNDVSKATQNMVPTQEIPTSTNQNNIKYIKIEDCQSQFKKYKESLNSTMNIIIEKMIEEFKIKNELSITKETEQIIKAHEKELEDIKKEMKEAHDKEIENIKKENTEKMNKENQRTNETRIINKKIITEINSKNEIIENLLTEKNNLTKANDELAIANVELTNEKNKLAKANDELATANVELTNEKNKLAKANDELTNELTNKYKQIEKSQDINIENKKKYINNTDLINKKNKDIHDKNTKTIDNLKDEIITLQSMLNNKNRVKKEFGVEM